MRGSGLPKPLPKPHPPQDTYLLSSSLNMIDQSFAGFFALDSL
jgi:hypothetical protein